MVWGYVVAGWIITAVAAASATLSADWVPVLCAVIAALATVGQTWIGVRRKRSNDAPTARERQLEERLFLALKAYQDLTKEIAERDSTISSLRSSVRKLRSQVRQLQADGSRRRRSGSGS